MTHLLIVEDDHLLADGLANALAQDADDIGVASTYVQAVNHLQHQRVDLVLLDIQLPDGSGFDLLPLAQRQAERIICLTGNDAEWDIVRALEAGADDYLTKPFSLAVLRARVRTQLRQIMPCRQYKDAHLCLDFNRLVFEAGGVDLPLSGQEIRFLRRLLEENGQVVSRTEFMNLLWSGNCQVSNDNALSMLATRLRRKIEPNGQAPHYIQTVHGQGYRWGGVENDV